MRSPPLLPAALLVALGALAAAAPPARADTPVGVDGVDKDTREAILDLLPDRDRPTTLFEAERIAEEAAARAMAWLRSEGYYAASVTPQTTAEPPSARLLIAPGARFRFAAPQMTFTDEAPSAAALASLHLSLAHIAPGAPARAADVLAAEAAALSALHRSGYADASASPRRILVDHASAEVTAHFSLQAGAFARLGALRAEPSDVLRDDFVLHLRNWQPGQPYDPDRLAQVRRDLVTTGAMARVNTRLGPSDTDGVRDVVLEIERARRNAYELGLGYSTTEGVGIDAEWTRRNFSRRADSLIVSATLGELRQILSAELARPHGAGIGRARRLSLSLSREDSEAFVRQGVALSASVDAEPRLDLGLSYGAQLAADRFDEAGGVRNAIVLTGFGEARNDTRDNRFDPHDGSLVTLRLEPSVSAGDAGLAFARATAEGRLFESFTTQDRLTVAARARAGWLEALSGNVNDVPPDRRFYAGGGGSVRGYGYNSIYPTERDALGLTPGGQGLLETSLEARWRLGDRFGAAAFVDGGNAFDDWGDAADLRWGAGIGVRYDLGFAPLRIDVATPLDRRDGDPDYAVYISIGQAF